MLDSLILFRHWHLSHSIFPPAIFFSLTSLLLSLFIFLSVTLCVSAEQDFFFFQIEIAV